MSTRLQCDQCHAVVDEDDVGTIRHRTICPGGPGDQSPDEYEPICPACGARDSLDDYEEPPMNIRDMTVGELLCSIEEEWGGTAMYAHVQLHWISFGPAPGKATLEWYREDAKAMDAQLGTWEEFVRAVSAHCAKGPARQAEQDRQDASRLEAAGWTVAPPAGAQAEQNCPVPAGAER